ncbi:MAG: right-handed parallel beta-helix repeat-containing protein [Luteolibacter sp.]
MVRSAPNEMLAERYQQGLVEFDQAMAVVREFLESVGLAQRVPDVKIDPEMSEEVRFGVFVASNEVSKAVGSPAVPAAKPAEAASRPLPAEGDPELSGGHLFRTIAWILVVVSLLSFGGWGYLKYQEAEEMRKRERVVFLEREGAIFIENRRWPEATETFDEIESIYPDSELVMMGRRSIEAGMVEEQNQFIGYWKGEAIAAFDASRWDDAEKAAQQVLDKYPDEKELTDLIAKIAVAKREEERQKAFEYVRELIEERKFVEAVSTAEKLAQIELSDAEAVKLLTQANAAKAKAEADLERARILLAQAAERDKGEFDEEALEWIREAVSLAPDDAEILARYEKMAAYTRTIRVPEEFKTVGEAFDAARDKDRIVVGEGVWEGPFFLNVGAEIEGLSGKTVMQCEADKGSVITIGAGVIGARLSGVTLRHQSFDAGEERFSLAQLSGGQADFADCHFEQGSGHGLAVTAGGKAKVQRCRFTENGWNGIAVMGAGSRLEAEENILKGNFQNGIESWDDGTAILKNNQCTGNSRNGIHADNGKSAIEATGNTLSGNREFGMVISSAASGNVSGNTLEKNFLGGLVVKAAASAVAVTANEIRANEGTGLVLEKGLSKDAYSGNRISGNKGKDLVLDADLTVD